MTAAPGFHSIVFPNEAHEPAGPRPDLRDVFHDLFLDAVFTAAYGGFMPREKPALYVVNRTDDEAPFRAEVLSLLQALFGTPLHDASVVQYRQAALRDLQQASVNKGMQAFQQGMRRMRESLRRSEKAFNAIEGQRWFVDAVLIYGQTLDALQGMLAAAELPSQALQALREHAAALQTSAEQTARTSEARALIDAMAQLRYAVRIDGTTVSVLQDPHEPDYSVTVAEAFSRFRQGEVKDYRVQFTPGSGLNPVEGQILDRVAMLHPEVFGRLAQFCEAQQTFADARLLRLDRELAWYLCWIDYTQRFERGGLAVCFPELTPEQGTIDAGEAFDMALAWQCLDGQVAVVCNDVALQGDERMIVVTGPNHGGKTTLARTFGQLHHLAALGLTVAARSATLLLCDQMFTHFERVEDISSQRGKLQDDLVRMHHILTAATPRSLVLMNEIFSSTTLDDALWLARRIMAQLSAIGAACVFVTFLDELSTFDAHTVSMVGAVDAHDPTLRTFKVVRRAADGQSYAMALAQKFGVTRQQLLERIPA
ncbi:MutS-related protein [Thiomonas intermedia]|uniref:MutS-related protein n=1 Tax=Thiomonas intermedia TaxID=926 RepID=UPI0009A4C3F1|nr:DNA mismatch repair protein MutS [Thiomonas intermedia]